MPKNTRPQSKNQPNVPSVLQDPRLISGAELFEGPLPERQDIIEELLPAGAIVALGGGAGVGKSTISRQMTISLTTGSPFLGRKVIAQGPVLVVSAEEGRLKIRRGLEDVATEEGVDLEALKQNLFVVARETPLALSRESDAEFIERIAAEVKPRLIIFDSAALVLGVDLNSAVEVVQVQAWLMRLITILDGGSILLISHTRKKGSDQPVIEDLFGSFVLGAGLDCAYHLTRVAAKGKVKWTCTKMREACHPEEMELFRDEDRGGHTLRVAGEHCSGSEIDASIESVLTDQPGISRTKLTLEVQNDCGASKRLIAARIEALLAANAIVEKGRKKPLRLIWVE